MLDMLTQVQVLLQQNFTARKFYSRMFQILCIFYTKNIRLPILLAYSLCKLIYFFRHLRHEVFGHHIFLNEKPDELYQSVLMEVLFL